MSECIVKLLEQYLAHNKQHLNVSVIITGCTLYYDVPTCQTVRICACQFHCYVSSSYHSRPAINIE